MMQRINRGMQRLLVFPIVILLAALGQIAWWALDREPPVIYDDAAKYEQIAPDTVRLVFHQRRTRFCDVDVRRWVRDSAGYRYYLQPVRLTADQVKEIHRDTPGLVSVIVRIPPKNNPGRQEYTYNVALEFSCGANVMHWIWPIRVDYAVPFFAE